MKYIKHIENFSPKEETFTPIDYYQFNRGIYGADFNSHYYHYSNIFINTISENYKEFVKKNWKEFTPSELNHLSFKINPQYLYSTDDENDDAVSHHQKKWGSLTSYGIYYKYQSTYPDRWNLIIIKTEDDWLYCKLLVPSNVNNWNVLSDQEMHNQLGELWELSEKSRKSTISLYFKCDQYYGLEDLYNYITQQIKPHTIKENFNPMKSDWKEISHKISKTFRFKNFVQAVYFVNKVAEISEDLNHHPLIKIDYNLVILQIWSHEEAKVTNKCWKLAEEIEKIEVPDIY